MSFALDLSRLTEKAKGQTELVVKKVMLELFSKVVMKSPVDTGRFRANWVTAYSSPDRSTTETTDKSGGEALGKIAQKVSEMKFDGRSVFLTNSLPYSQRLEHGWSGQAPQGMVRLSLIEITNQYGR